MVSDGGKGSRPRPYSVDPDTFDSNWDMIFNRRRKSDSEKFEQAILADEYYDLDSPDDQEQNQDQIDPKSVDK